MFEHSFKYHVKPIQIPELGRVMIALILIDYAYGSSWH